MTAAAIDFDRVYGISEAVHATAADGELILVDMDAEKFFGVGEVGAAVWTGLAEGRTLRQIVEQIAGEYDVDRETLTTCIERFAQSLQDRKWLVSAGNRA